MHHLKTDYSDLSVFDFIGKARQIHDCLSNPVFTGVNPGLAYLQGLIDTANSAAIADPVNVIARDQALAVLHNTLGIVGAWVKNYCNNDLVKLQTSGFKVVVRSPIGPMPQPQGLKASTSGMPGSGLVFLKWKRIYGCRLFQIQCAPYSTSEWKECSTSTKIRCEISGLTTGVWSFRVIAISRSGKSIPSQPISIVVG